MGIPSNAEESGKSRGRCTAIQHPENRCQDLITRRISLVLEKVPHVLTGVSFAISVNA